MRARRHDDCHGFASFLSALRFEKRILKHGILLAGKAIDTGRERMFRTGANAGVKPATTYSTVPPGHYATWHVLAECHSQVCSRGLDPLVRPLPREPIARAL